MFETIAMIVIFGLIAFIAGLVLGHNAGWSEGFRAKQDFQDTLHRQEEYQE